MVYGKQDGVEAFIQLLRLGESLGEVKSAHMYDDSLFSVVGSDFQLNLTQNEKPPVRGG